MNEAAGASWRPFCEMGRVPSKLTLMRAKAIKLQADPI
jgi:hypothetical protein